MKLLSLVSRHKTEQFVLGIVTCDKKLIFFNNRKCLAQWLTNDEAPKHTPKANIQQNFLQGKMFNSQELDDVLKPLKSKHCIDNLGVYFNS